MKFAVPDTVYLFLLLVSSTNAPAENSPPTGADSISPLPGVPKHKRNYIRRGGDYEQLHTDYNVILNNFQSYNLETACKKAGMGRTTFYQKRHITEMKYVDADYYQELKQRSAVDKMTIKDFSKLCKEQLNKSPYKQQVKTLKQDGKLLP